MKKLLFSLLLIIPITLFAQDLEYAKKLIDSLSHVKYHGRGYVRLGDFKTSKMLAYHMREIGLKQFKYDRSPSYFQRLEMPVNYFPGEIKLNIDGVELKAGTDFLPMPTSGSTKRKLYIGAHFLQVSELDKGEFKKLSKNDMDKKALIIDKKAFEGQEENEFYKKATERNDLGAAVIIYLESGNLVHAVSQQADDFPSLVVKKDKFPKDAKIVTVEVNNEFKEYYKANNVVGYIQGTVKPDSFIVIGAHYDHLGMIGRDILFPGANDNASGVAMMLDLAKKFNTEGQRRRRGEEPVPDPVYSMVFVAFCGEELGLIGSDFFTFRSPYWLPKTKFMISLDMVGAGKDGIGIVNGKSEHFMASRIQSINDKKQYVSSIQLRDNSPISDHYPFTEEGVDAIFIYGKGEHPYHSIDDTAEKLPLDEYEDIYSLIYDFIRSVEEPFRPKEEGRRGRR